MTGATIGVDVTGQEKIFKAFQALGDIAFAYSYSMVLVEIQVPSIYQSNHIPTPIKVLPFTIIKNLSYHYLIIHTILPLNKDLV